MLLSKLTIEVHGSNNLNEEIMQSLVKSQWGPKAIKHVRDVLAEAGISLSVTGKREDVKTKTTPVKLPTPSVQVVTTVSKKPAKKEVASLDSMTKTALIEYCKQVGIKLLSYQTKSEIIRTIKEARI